jgi:hypothetical protein
MKMTQQREKFCCRSRDLNINESATGIPNFKLSEDDKLTRGITKIGKERGRNSYRKNKEILG